MSRYEKQWPCCGDTTITEAWEPDSCPFCASVSAAPTPAKTSLDHFIEDVEAAGLEKPQPLTKTKIINIINKLRNKYPYPGGNGLRFDIELARAIEAAHGIHPAPPAMKGEQP